MSYENRQGRYVIWCWNMAFWHLVTGEVSLRVTSIYGESESQ